MTDVTNKLLGLISFICLGSAFILWNTNDVSLNVMGWLFFIVFIVTDLTYLES